MKTFMKRLWALLVFLLTGRAQRHYGRKQRDPDDPRDHRYVPDADVLNSLPPEVDLRDQDGAIFDQGRLGSCTANGWLGLFLFVCKKLFGDTFFGSRLQLYYDEREMEGTAGEDAGAYVRDGARCLATKGVCAETEWPYDIARYAEKPPDQCYIDAQNNKIVEYMRISQDVKHLKACLAEKFPFVFGFEVYESFESASVTRTGIMPMPGPDERLVGGHCVVAIGYVDAHGQAKFFRNADRLKHSASRLSSKLSHALRIVTGIRAFPVTPPANTIICRNSWGTRWGDRGYFYMPYDFITNSSYASDFWTVRKVTHKKAA